MKIATFLITSFLIFISSTTLAAPRKDISINELVDQYYTIKEKQKAFSSKKKNILFHQAEILQNHCPAPAPSCMDAFCNRLGSHRCDELGEIKEVGRACRGNENGLCIDSVCKRLGSHRCDELGELIEVGRACVGNQSAECFESVCVRLGSHRCDESGEVKEVLNACSGND